jgi:hypothetical protein
LVYLVVVVLQTLPARKKSLQKKVDEVKLKYQEGKKGRGTPNEKSRKNGKSKQRMKSTGERKQQPLLPRRLCLHQI